MVTADLSILARATEVTCLQIKKSTIDGDNRYQASNDCMNAVFSNGYSILAPTRIKPMTTTASYMITNIHDIVFKHKLYNTILPGKFLMSTGGKWIPYGFALLAWGKTLISILCNDPIKRAKKRGYQLK
ncbi:MAG: hypothetical protein IJL78_02410 [Lachnospiraceae bacterium]|nr:hypothetical protein [Lachnospiraceae bacterium]